MEGTRHMKKSIAAVSLVLFVLVVFASSASATNFEPYSGYNYNAWGTSMSAPNGYWPADMMDGTTLGAGMFSNPSDLFYREGELYILDSGNSRIVVLDGTFKLSRVIDTFIMAGEKQELLNPTGMYIRSDGSFLLCDTDNERILDCKADGEIKNILTKPTDEIYPENIAFHPTKVIEDTAGNIYVIVADFYYGAVCYNPNGTFNSFFGSNRVEITAKMLFDRLWKSILPAQTSKYISNYVPVNYSNFDIDAEDFIFTTTRQTKNSLDEIKKLNNVGINILRSESSYDTLNKNDYGDKERIRYKGETSDSQFTDIDISDDGLMSALDFNSNKIFQYDEESNLLFVFGGKGDQKGLFKRPIAIETIGNDIIVLDSEKNNLTLFKPTEFGKIVHRAVKFYVDGEFGNAVPEWQAILKLDSNYEPAYRGIGKALAEQQQYKESLKYLKLGYDRESYSNSLRRVRTDFIKDNLIVIGVIGIVAFLLLLYGKKWVRLLLHNRTSADSGPDEETPFQVMLHPISGYDTIRRTNRFSLLLLSIMVVALWFVASILQRQETGFVFNMNNPLQLNIMLLFTKTFGIAILWTVSNWGISTLVNGEGSFKRIWIVSSYAILPYAVSMIISTIASNVTTYEEGSLLRIIVYIGIAWSLFMLFIGIKEVNQFTFSQAVVNVLMTLIGMLLVVFVIVLFGSLVQQLMIFISTLYNELILRSN